MSRKNNKKKLQQDQQTINNNLSRFEEATQRLNNSNISIFDFMPLGINPSPLSSQGQLIDSSNYSLISLNRTLLSYMYLTHGVVQTMIDQPVEDAFRGGFNLKSDQIDADELTKLIDYVDSKHYLDKLMATLKWQRLFGGGCLIINTDQDPTTELDIKLINEDTPLDFISADRWECLLTYGREDIDPCPFSYYAQSIHKSRVIKLVGKEAPSLIRRQLQGWGMTEIERILRPLNSYIKNENLIYELLDEAKIDVFKIKDFNTAIATSAGMTKIRNRVQLANQQKSFQSALSMDTNDDYIQKQLSFAGLSEILTQLRIGLASAIKFPVTKLFGISASGFNSGEDDIENYNSLVESEVRTKCKDSILTIYKLAAQQLFGLVPDFTMEFKSLRVLNSEQEETIKNQKFNRLLSLRDRGDFNNIEDFYAILKAENVMNIQTPVAEGLEEPETPEYIAEGGTNLTIKEPKQK